MDRRLAYAGLVSTAFIWGTTFPIIKYTLPYIDPLSFLFFRFIIASAVLFPFVIKKIRKNDAIFGTVVGIPLFVGYVSQTIGLQFTSPSMSGLITGIYVVLTPVFSIFVLRSGRDLTKILFAAIAFFGMVLMTVNSTSGEFFGNMLTLICAVSYAFQMVYTEKFLKDGDPLVFTFFQLLVVGALSLVFHPSALLRFSSLEIPYVAFSVVFNAVFGSAIAIWIMSVSIKRISAYLSALILILEPVFAVAVSTLLFHNSITIPMMIGGTIIIVSMILAIRRENSKR